MIDKNIFEEVKKRIPTQRTRLLKILRAAGEEGVLNTELVKVCIGYRSRIAELYQQGYEIECHHVEGVSGLCTYILRREPESKRKPKPAIDIFEEQLKNKLPSSANSVIDILADVLKNSNLNIVRRAGSHKTKTLEEAR
jgi:hypothetical protein